MKRIVICSDGTWASPAQATPTNILKLSRGVAPNDAHGNKQVVFYDWGVGTDRKKVGGGIGGEGIDKNIMDCYRFIVHNYEPGDELFFFGFSRGAYTIRSLAGFIRNCGLLKREHAEQIPQAFRLYRKRKPTSHPDAPTAKKYRRDYAVADLTPITFMGAFDTVGSLGIPTLYWGLFDDDDEYLFHDTSPSKIVKCVRHALSIDENREDFPPTLWKERPNSDIKQVWFSGVHCDIGGGYKEHGLSDIALQWVLDEAKIHGLVTEAHFLKDIQPDASQRAHNERKKLYKLRGDHNRGQHNMPESPLIHQSVKDRWEAATSRSRSKALKAYFEVHPAFACFFSWSE